MVSVLCSRHLTGTVQSPKDNSSTAGPKTNAGENGVGLTDFYSYMPTHQYIFTPTREMWPASTEPEAS